ncbi:unnamed protein product, partial [Iphiclides podalirius]
MNAWPTEGSDAMGPTVTRAVSAISCQPPLKNGGDLRETGYLIAVGSRTARFRRKHRKKLLWIVLLILLILAVLNLALLIYSANLALSIDDTVNPCNNFYQYSCGKWAESHPRPDAYRSYDWFRDKQTKVYTAVRDFFERKEALNTTQYPKPVQQAKDMYTACIDVETLDIRGLNPVLDVLKELRLPVYPTLINLTNDVDYNNYTFDWLEAVIKIKKNLGMDVLIGFDIFADTKNSSIYRLSMGSPETTNPFPSMHNKRKRHKRRNKAKHSNFFRSRQSSRETKFISAKENHRENIIGDDTEEVVDVLAIHTTSELRSVFDKLYVDLGEAYNTAESSPSRSLRCASAVDDMLGMAVAYVLADPNFVKATKPKIQVMLKELKNALAHLIGKTKWMDDNTKLETYRKIIDMRTLIGFPDWLMERGKLEMFYEGVEVNKEHHLENMINVVQVKIKKALNGFRKVHNYSAWATNPTEVNAYHTFQKNTISNSLNYGALGTILGHEITHGFDNYGRLFDKNGNFIPWWTNQTIELYVNMTQCFVEQYSSFYVQELDAHVNGKNTLGENIADNGGVREALVALKHHLWKYGPEPKLPGFEHLTPEQLFFLSYGNLWCGVATKDALKADLEDEHSPQIFRAIGSLQNMEDFARAWQCAPGSSMNPKKRCVIF